LIRPVAWGKVSLKRLDQMRVMAAPVGDLSTFSKMSLRSFWGMRFGVDLCGAIRLSRHFKWRARPVNT